MTRNKKFMPIAIDVANKKVLLIGGGKVALHKIASLKNYADNIFVLGKEVCDEIKNSDIPYVEKAYEKEDLNDSVLVYACTNIRKLNEEIKRDGNKLGKLVNVVDNPALCDFVSPAIYRKSYVSVAVSSNGQNVYKSIEVRDKIKNILDHDSTIFS